MVIERSTLESTKFSTPEEEIDYLRGKVSEREAELEQKNETVDREATIDTEVKTYRQTEPDKILTPEYQLSQKDIESIELDLVPEEHDTKMSELLLLLNEKGIRNTLSVVEKMNSPHIEDDFHRFLVQLDYSRQFDRAREIGRF